MDNKIKNILIIIFGFVFFNVNISQAAIISVLTQNKSNIATRIEVDIFIDTENKNINSFELTLVYPKELLVFDGYSDKNSVVPIWIFEPKKIKDGEIYFSGLIPGGIDRLYDPINLNDNNIKLVKLFFITKSQGVGNLLIKNGLVLRNDGKGTKENLTLKSFNFSVISQNKKDESLNIKEKIDTLSLNDSKPPLHFKINIIDRSLLVRSPRLAVFNTKDETSGIERYEVRVGYGKYKIAQSPFPLPYRLFSFNLGVKAYDFSGNFVEEEIVVPGETTKYLFTILFGIMISILIYRIIIYKNKKNEIL